MKKHYYKTAIIWILILFIATGCAGGKKEVEGTEIPPLDIELPSYPIDKLPKVIELTISATGDVALGNYIGQGYSNSFDQTYEEVQDYSYFFQNVADIFAKDDMTLVNLECVLTNSENAAPGRDFSIKGNPDYINILPAGNVDAVSMENNHRRDFGERGTTDTVAALNSVNLPYAYEENLGMYEVEGVKIGWVAVNHASFGGSVEPLLQDGIKRLKEDGADLVIACCHWGIEKENYAIEAQRTLGKKCIDWGADVVIGHHPHVIQGIEAYQGKYIVYSLGNFCFSANKNPPDKDTMIFQQTFQFTKTKADNGTENVALTQCGQAKIIPCSISSVVDRNDYCPTPLTGAEGQRVIDRVNNYSADYGVTADKDGVLTWTNEN